MCFLKEEINLWGYPKISLATLSTASTITFRSTSYDTVTPMANSTTTFISATSTTQTTNTSSTSTNVTPWGWHWWWQQQRQQRRPKRQTQRQRNKDKQEGYFSSSHQKVVLNLILHTYKFLPTLRVWDFPGSDCWVPGWVTGLLWESAGS